MIPFLWLCYMGCFFLIDESVTVIRENYCKFIIMSDHIHFLYENKTHAPCTFCFFQDRVPAFSPEKARAFIEKEMGCSVDVVFKEFEDRPIAAASLGQVLSSNIFQHIHYS